MTENVRKLVTLETVVSVNPIPDADAIEVARVRGWDVVVRKGEVAAGDQVLYFEIDSSLPLEDERFAFLEPRGSKILEDGKKVHVLKTVRLRGQYSQGLILPAEQFPEIYGGRDIADALDVEKYEPPVPAELGGDAVGAFPTDVVQKTDSERVQNLTNIYEHLRASGAWVATEKIDGSSVTIIVTGDPEAPFRVASRNWELKPDSKLTSVKLAERHGLADLPSGMVIQGEAYGEGIQSNPLGVTGTEIAVFSVFSGPRQPLPRSEWPEKLQKLAAPVLDLELPETVDAAVAQVDGLKSVISPKRQAEGVVWHEISGKQFPELEYRANFKAINNKFLARQK